MIAASLLVLVAWLWFLALIMVIGAQVNAVALGLGPLPRDVPHSIAQVYRHSERRAQAEGAAKPWDQVETRRKAAR